MKNQFLIICLLFLSCGYGKAQSVVSVENPCCEYLKNPLGIDIQQPRFSWELTSSELNKKQKAYRILVASDKSALENNKADMWDSKKTAGDASNQICYKGKQLKSNTLYYWKVQVWDEQNISSEWSSVAHFLVGPLTPCDWRAQWIGEKEEPVAPEDQYYTPQGYLSQQEDSPNVNKWVVIDLGSAQTFDEVKIYPVSRREKAFPLRFTIEAAVYSDFSDGGSDRRRIATRQPDTIGRILLQKNGVSGKSSIYPFECLQIISCGEGQIRIWHFRMGSSV